MLHWTIDVSVVPVFRCGPSRVDSPHHRPEGNHFLGFSMHPCPVEKMIVILFVTGFNPVAVVPFFKQRKDEVVLVQWHVHQDRFIPFTRFLN